jgi:hypothetical protein
MKKLLVGAVGLVVLSAGVAFAQDTTIVTADAGFMAFLTDILRTVVDAALAIGLPILIVKGFSLIGVKLEESKRDALVTTLRNRAGGYINELGEEAKNLKLDVRDPRLAKWVQDAQKSAPEALAWAGLDSKEIARRIIEQVPQVLNTTEKPNA